ncbi:MAG: S16 family serine protease [Halobacteriota archaeon]
MLALEELDVNSYAGAVSDVNVSIEPGAGYVFVATKPLTGSDFQETAQTAADVAAARAHVDLSRQDIKFVVHVPEKVDAVDGPSAGLPMAIAVYSAITKMPTNKYVYGTGTIESDGRVNRVGGVYWKALAAAESGAKVIIVPSNETVVNTTNPLATSGGVNLQSELRKNGYNVTVVGVKNIDEALPYYFS